MSVSDVDQPDLPAHNYALRLEYDGSHFAGFQRQAPGVPTVQEALEQAIGVVTRQPITIHCCGRTDSGVHATGQIAGFRLYEPLADARRFIHSVNGLLPEAIAVTRLIVVPADFHPRFSCVAREYEYLIWNGQYRPVHWRKHALWIRDPLDLDDLNARFTEISGYNDYAAFTRAEHKDEGTIRYLPLADFRYLDDPLGGEGRLVAFRVRGNAFLHNMIRILAGTAIDYTQGKLRHSLLEILSSRDRRLAGRTAPSEGLYFREAYYRSLPGVTGLAVLDDFPDFRAEARRSHAERLRERGQ